MRILKVVFWIFVAVVIILALALVFTSPQSVRANPGTNINATTTEHFAWNDILGWIDFYNTDTVTVWGTRVEGYASSSFGDVSLDCSTSPNGNICATSNYGICNGPGPHNTDGTCPNGDGGDSTSGALTGYAWNDNVGWISFNCDQTDHGGSAHCEANGGADYNVTIDSNGDFLGHAWNDNVGWISLNYNSSGVSPSSSYKVATAWRATSTVGYLESVVIDTQVQNGATLNSITWIGDSPTSSQTYVDFQIAVSNSSSGPWTFEGPGGDTNTYYGLSCESNFQGGVNADGAPENTPVCINPSRVNNYRYIRYRVRLRSNRLQTLAPQVDDIILNWSR